MDKRNFMEGGRYDTSTLHFFLVFWDTLSTIMIFSNWSTHLDKICWKAIVY